MVDQFHVAHGTHPFAFLAFTIPQQVGNCKRFHEEIGKILPLFVHVVEKTKEE